MARLKKEDWDKIRDLYINKGMTVRAIAERYNVALTTIAHKSVREQWEEKRIQIRQQKTNKTLTQGKKDVIDQVLDDRKRIESAARKELKRIEEMIDDMDIKSVKIISAAIKDIRDILGIRSDLDIEEQTVRIESIRKATQDTDKEIKVVISADAEDYAN